MNGITETGTENNALQNKAYRGQELDHSAKARSQLPLSAANKTLA